MKTYLVGGAIRDKLLGYEIKERDWVVVGATEQDMLNLGYMKVGKKFPVFLHPRTHDEYALARIEHKTGVGYKGFDFDVDVHITLEEDLKRRDLTINAIAQSTDGKLIDPYNGQEDLRNKILRHVSLAFIEDPVRVLRLARFTAKLADFTVHESTIELVKIMAKNGELNALVPERIWKELCKALNEPKPSRFFTFLFQCDVLQIIFPLIHKNFATICLALDNACVVFNNDVERCTAMLACLNIEEINEFSTNYRLPKKYVVMAKLVASFYIKYEQISHRHASASEKTEFFTQIYSHKSLRNKAELRQLFADCCELVYLAKHHIALTQRSELKPSFFKS